MRFKILPTVMLVSAFLFGTFVQKQSAYPAVWDEIHVGMPYDEVIKRIGEPAPYMLEKGPSWTEQTLTGDNELRIYFTDNRVAIIGVRRHIGTANYGYNQIIRFENHRMPQ